MAPETFTSNYKFREKPGLKKTPPYWYPYTSMAKGRWVGRELLEIVSTEFRDRSMEYYRYALESGVTTVNGKIARPDTLVKNGDRIENVVHRHEPPVSSTPVKILLEDKEREFIVIDKPGSIPVHPAGRYNKHSLTEILKNEFGYDKIYTVNRLDRLTSGLMIIPTSAARATQLTSEFMAGTVRKEYVARCKGKFPEEEVVFDQPLLTVDRQMGLNIVHPEGKPAKTIFQLIRYDENTDSSIVHCKPLTGRSHQLRVHLQYLGHPIANDTIYSEDRIWGPNLGKGGIDLISSNERSAPVAPPQFEFQPESNPENISAKESFATEDDSAKLKLLPRETGHDIGMGSPVPLSAEAVRVITNLRNMKDEDEDWSRWRDVVFRAKGKLHPNHIVIPPPPPQNRRKRGGPVGLETPEGTGTPGSETATTLAVAPEELEGIVVSTTSGADAGPSTPSVKSDDEGEATAGTTVPNPPQIPAEEAIAKVEAYHTSPEGQPVPIGGYPGTEDLLYCPDCYLPLHPDPNTEKLYIFLHALRYTTSLGAFETEMPAWAAPGFEWDRS